jgi:hypothetical protein
MKHKEFNILTKKQHRDGSTTKAEILELKNA